MKINGKSQFHNFRVFLPSGFNSIWGIFLSESQFWECANGSGLKGVFSLLALRLDSAVQHNRNWWFWEGRFVLQSSSEGKENRALFFTA